MYPVMEAVVANRTATKKMLFGMLNCSTFHDLMFVVYCCELFLFKKNNTEIKEEEMVVCIVKCYVSRL